MAGDDKDLDAKNADGPESTAVADTDPNPPDEKSTADAVSNLSEEETAVNADPDSPDEEAAQEKIPAELAEQPTEEKPDRDEGEKDEDAADEDPKNEGMTLRDHLKDLRSCLFKSFLWLIAGFCICYPFHEELFTLLFRPLIAVLPEGGKLVYLSPPEAFFTYMKVTLAAGLFVASPMVFYHLWAFIAPGLYREEKLYILPVAFFSAFFFISGGLFCYFVVFDLAFTFFMSYNKGYVQAMPALDETLSFVLQFLLAFGVVFEMPLFAFFLSRIGIVTADSLRRFRRYAILIIVIVAAILTPPDVASQLLMAGPMILLYEIGIIIAALFGKKSKKEAGPEKEVEEDELEDND
ncbi:MAG: twin-arginine translocase subunit TatC [Desulfovibrio sp.]|jgi:sec-independent protein translocase protein TatC|nr:twin-arginine translocase subunit TatC [Desulfovibrio sp.]